MPREVGSQHLEAMSEPGCCSSFCGGIWNKIKEGHVKTSARMVAFIAVVGMLACAIAVGLSSDCNITPGIIGMVTSLFLIICEVRFCRLRWHFAIFLNLLFNHTRSASILVWVYSSMCRVRRQDGSCHAEFHFQGTHVHRPWHCKLLLLLKYPASTPLSSKCSISLSRSACVDPCGAFVF